MNVERFARLGIPECFVLVPGQRLVGYTLGERGRQPIVPQRGTWRSDVLGMDLALEDGDVRFYVGTAPLPFGRELVDKLTAMVNGAVHRAQEEARRAQEEARRAEEQTERAERFAAKLRELGVDPDTLE
ncbi:MAG TPA: hypothetical protein RMH99_11530 [Sandaracinaceae bacterium LLY-WYZ-13_1]|nr:hypothetical protein [Sandaracinaceae bacterium LLY-WYZ-13_1]